MKTTKVTIDVTEKHIEEGIASDCLSCPVALAIADHVKYDVETHVMWRRVRLCVPCVGGTQNARLTKEVQEWIDSFDYLGRYAPGTKLLPISFPLRIRKDFLRKVQS